MARRTAAIARHVSFAQIICIRKRDVSFMLTEQFFKHIFKVIKPATQVNSACKAWAGRERPISASQSCMDINRHTARCASSVHVVSQCKLALALLYNNGKNAERCLIGAAAEFDEAEENGKRVTASERAAVENRLICAKDNKEIDVKVLLQRYGLNYKHNLQRLQANLVSMVCPIIGRPAPFKCLTRRICTGKESPLGGSVSPPVKSLPPEEFSPAQSLL